MEHRVSHKDPELADELRQGTGQGRPDGIYDTEANHGESYFRDPPAARHEGRRELHVDKGLFGTYEHGDGHLQQLVALREVAQGDQQEPQSGRVAS